MTRKRAFYICRGCDEPFPHPGSRRTFCTVECACWSRIEVRDIDECWPWMAGKTKWGYGKFAYEGAYLYAHKVAYSTLIEPIECGLEGCHHCDNPGCCNPFHIFPGTHADNIRDMDAKGRRVTRAHKGELCGASRLKETQVLAIRADHAAGLGGYRALAAKYGCGPSAISRIVRRTHWTHI